MVLGAAPVQTLRVGAVATDGILSIPMRPRNRLLLVGGLALVAAGSLFAWRTRPPRPALPPPAAPVAARPEARVAPPAAAPAPAVPVEDVEARAQEAADVRAADPVWLDAEGEPTRELVLASLRDAVERHIPSHKLSSDEYARLADAVMRMRETQAGLRSLPLDEEHAEQLRALREQLADAAAEFEYVLDMSPAEFSARAQPGLGVTPPDDAEDTPSAPAREDAPPVYLDDLPRP